jgi:hypothetical protein
MAKRKNPEPFITTQAEADALVATIKERRAKAKQIRDEAIGALETQIDMHNQTHDEEFDRTTQLCFEKTGHRHIDGLIRGDCPYCGYGPR